MQCGSFVRRGGKKNIVKEWWTVAHRELDGRLPPEEDGIESCDGDIGVSISVYNSGGCCCGCCYSDIEFEINYKCKKCDNTYFGELPQTKEELASFLEVSIDNFTEDDRSNLIEKRKEERRIYEEAVQEQEEKVLAQKMKAEKAREKLKKTKKTKKKR